MYSTSPTTRPDPSWFRWASGTLLPDQTGARRSRLGRPGSRSTAAPAVAAMWPPPGLQARGRALLAHLRSHSGPTLHTGRQPSGHVGVPAGLVRDEPGGSSRHPRLRRKRRNGHGPAGPHGHQLQLLQPALLEHDTSDPRRPELNRHLAHAEQRGRLVRRDTPPLSQPGVPRSGSRSSMRQVMRLVGLTAGLAVCTRAQGSGRDVPRHRQLRCGHSAQGKEGDEVGRRRRRPLGLAGGPACRVPVGGFDERAALRCACRTAGRPQGGSRDGHQLRHQVCVAEAVRPAFVQRRALCGASFQPA